MQINSTIKVPAKRDRLALLLPHDFPAWLLVWLRVARVLQVLVSLLRALFGLGLAVRIRIESLDRLAEGHRLRTCAGRAL